VDRPAHTASGLALARISNLDALRRRRSGHRVGIRCPESIAAHAGHVPAWLDEDEEDGPADDGVPVSGCARDERVTATTPKSQMNSIQEDHFAARHRRDGIRNHRDPRDHPSDHSHPVLRAARLAAGPRATERLPTFGGMSSPTAVLLQVTVAARASGHHRCVGGQLRTRSRDPSRAASQPSRRPNRPRARR
jgi:hypothetical protein